MPAYEEYSTSTLMQHLRRNGVEPSLISVLEENSVDGQAFEQCDDDALREMGILPWGARRSILRIKECMQGGRQPQPASCLITVSQIVEKLERAFRNTPEEYEDVKRIFEREQIDGRAIQELDHDTLKSFAQRARKSGDEGYSMMKWGVRSKILSLGTKLVPTQQSMTSSWAEAANAEAMPVSDVRGRDTKERGFFAVPDISTAFPPPDAPIVVLQDDATAEGRLESRMREICGKLSLLPCEQWRRYLEHASLDWDLLKGLSEHCKSNVDCHLSPPSYLTGRVGDHLPKVSLDGNDSMRPLSECTQLERCVIKGVVPKKSQEVTVQCYVDGIPGKALICGSSIIKETFQVAAERPTINFLRGVNCTVFSNVTVVFGGGSSDHHATCAVTNCIFYECKVSCSAHGGRASADRAATEAMGWVQVQNCVFISCKWVPRAFSNSIVKNNVFVNCDLTLRNTAEGELSENLLVVLDKPDFCNFQKGCKIQYVRNLIRGTLETLRKQFHEDHANTYDVLPFKGRRFNWNDLEDLSAIGCGRFGVVYKGKYLQTPVAIKELKEQHSPSAPDQDSASCDVKGMKRRIEEMVNEINILDNIRGAQLVSILGSGIHCNSKVFMVMELCEYGELEKWVQSHPPPPEVAALHMIRDVARALVYVHGSGYVHLDCRLANIFVNSGGQLKLGDFGIAVKENEPVSVYPRFYSDPILTRTPGVCQAKSHLDVWSLGLVVWGIFSQGVRPPVDDHHTSCTALLLRPPPCPEGVWGKLGLPCFVDPKERVSSTDFLKQADELLEELSSTMEKKGSSCVLDWLDPSTSISYSWDDLYDTYTYKEVE